MTMKINIRPAKREDLDNINRVIEAAVMTWDLPERVKRLSLSSYRYTDFDLEHLDMLVAEDQAHNILGIAALEPTNTKEIPAGRNPVLLHGIYVDPLHHHQGIGQRLFRKAEKMVYEHHYDGLLVKAQTNAEGFFIAQGMQRLAVENPERHYANRFWKSLR